jgi:hypothetical protein
MSSYILIIYLLVFVVVVGLVVRHYRRRTKQRDDEAMAGVLQLASVALGRPIDPAEYKAGTTTLQQLNVYVSIPPDTALHISENGERIVLLSRDGSGQIRRRIVPCTDILASEIMEDEVVLERTITKNRPSVVGTVGGALLGKGAGAVIGGLGYGSSMSVTTVASQVYAFKFRVVIDDPVEPLFTITWRDTSGKPMNKPSELHSKVM